VDLRICPVPLHLHLHLHLHLPRRPPCSLPPLLSPHRLLLQSRWMTCPTTEVSAGTCKRLAEAPPPPCAQPPSFPGVCDVSLFLSLPVRPLASVLRVKCRVGTEIRLLCVPSNTAFSRIKSKLQAKFNLPSLLYVQSQLLFMVVWVCVLVLMTTSFPCACDNPTVPACTGWTKTVTRCTLPPGRTGQL
jgi:hypothetical protein